MFKKLLQSLSKSQTAKQPSAAVPPPATAPAATPAPSGSGPLKPAAGLNQERVPPVKAAPNPEELCEIAPKMPKDQIRERLKLLYRRYNRSASSLDPAIRNEAEIMLDAIVRVREKHFGEI